MATAFGAGVCRGVDDAVLAGAFASSSPLMPTRRARLPKKPLTLPDDAADGAAGAAAFATRTGDATTGSAAREPVSPSDADENADRSDMDDVAMGRGGFTDGGTGGT